MPSDEEAPLTGSARRSNGQYGLVTRESVAALARFAGVRAAVYVALLAHRHRSTGEAWPTVASLCDWVGAHRRSVRRALDELEEAGAIDQVGRQRGNRAAIWRFPSEADLSAHLSRHHGPDAPSEVDGAPVAPSPDFDGAPPAPSTDGAPVAPIDGAISGRLMAHPLRHNIRGQEITGEEDARGRATPPPLAPAVSEEPEAIPAPPIASASNGHVPPEKSASTPPQADRGAARVIGHPEADRVAKALFCASDGKRPSTREVSAIQSIFDDPDPAVSQAAVEMPDDWWLESVLPEAQAMFERDPPPGRPRASLPRCVEHVARSHIANHIAGQEAERMAQIHARIRLAQQELESAAIADRLWAELMDDHGGDREAVLQSARWKATGLSAPPCEWPPTWRQEREEIVARGDSLPEEQIDKEANASRHRELTRQSMTEAEGAFESGLLEAWGAILAECDGNREHAEKAWNKRFRGEIPVPDSPAVEQATFDVF